MKILILMIFMLMGCGQKMGDKGRVKPLEPLDDQKISARYLPEGVVSRSNNKNDTPYFTGMTKEEKFSDFPVSVNEELIRRGEKNYQIFCTVCHGKNGEGDGMVVRRGFPKPPSLLEKMNDQREPGFLFYIMTNGLGVMDTYADLLDEHERWAIAAYIKYKMNDSGEGSK